MKLFTSADFEKWKPHALSGSSPDFQDMADIANAKRDAEIERLRGDLQLATRESLEARADYARLREALELAHGIVAFVRRMGHGHAGELMQLIDAFHARAAALEGK